MWEAWEEEYRDAIAEHLQGTSKPPLGTPPKGGLAAPAVSDMSKKDMFAALDAQIQKINKDVAGANDASDGTMRGFEAKLKAMFAGDMVKKLGALRDEDPRFAREMDGALGKEDTEEAKTRKMFEELEKNDFTFELSNVKNKGSDGKGKDNQIVYMWRKALEQDEELKVRTKARKKWADKAKVRQEWARGEHLKWKKVQEKQKATISDKEEAKTGTYLNLGRICHKEGGGASGLKAACNYAISCIQMGGEFVDFCEMTGQLKFLYIVRTLTDRWTTSWRSFTTWRNEDAPSSAATSSSATTSASAPFSVATPAAAETPVGKRTVVEPNAAAEPEGANTDKGDDKNKNRDKGDKPEKGEKGEKGDKKFKTPSWKTDFNADNGGQKCVSSFEVSFLRVEKVRV